MDIAPGRGRYGWLRRVEELDPVRDCHTIHRITAGYEFPWDYQRALEFALFRTYCVPTISALLARTGEFEKRPQKRYDDTSLLMSEMVEHGYDSERGRESLRTVNRMHAQYDISNDDMLYVLTTFIYEPIEWIDTYGWRRLHPHERLATFHFYSEVGKRMGIKDIPESYTEFAQFKLDYEERTFHFSEDNRRIGTYTLDLYCSWFPAALTPAVRQGVFALLDARMANAFGFPAGSPTLERAAVRALRTKARVERFLPTRKHSRTTADAGNKTYPGYPVGYSPRDLGTQSASPTRGCPVPTA
ncbi:oxygenase MpaB family protein [Rhodococcus sp. IEGM 1354]|uniref:oxygenase MpaB family protein n=1 Tax=Rhodococcus sp. IEGM 1354 TaxID=3047088 RepID=UPI0024B77144|nr:oxygenase MpaB family protein [Rhodococcus sp. IEGM 1354]MDI9933333.1 oxygenase MpaB family protein [Rhodococcus sp. IEGM 1354]